jgi:hypothetical protein
MVKVFGIAAIAITMAGPAFAQTVPPPYWGPFAAPRQSGPVAPGTATVPGPTFPNRAEKSLDSSNR